MNWQGATRREDAKAAKGSATRNEDGWDADIVV